MEQIRERLKCPHCGGDIDSDVGEFLMLGDLGDPNNQDTIPCPKCGKLIRIRITVELIQRGDT
uniref:Uncharacterized protein n=1 Tax=viral metagenome TaxID=1070528 RepID=A0A6M3M7X9_9ZZZZ